ncbi:hypothetical protein PCE1_003626 [Barthelona sp. PCE]
MFRGFRDCEFTLNIHIKSKVGIEVRNLHNVSIFVESTEHNNEISDLRISVIDSDVSVNYTGDANHKEWEFKGIRFKEVTITNSVFSYPNPYFYADTLHLSDATVSGFNDNFASGFFFQFICSDSIYSATGPIIGSHGSMRIRDSGHRITDDIQYTCVENCTVSIIGLLMIGAETDVLLKVENFSDMVFDTIYTDDEAYGVFPNVFSYQKSLVMRNLKFNQAMVFMTPAAYVYMHNVTATGHLLVNSASKYSVVLIHDSEIFELQFVGDYMDVTLNETLSNKTIITGRRQFYSLTVVGEHIEGVRILGMVDCVKRIVLDSLNVIAAERIEISNSGYFEDIYLKNCVITNVQIRNEFGIFPLDVNTYTLDGCFFHNVENHIKQEFYTDYMLLVNFTNTDVIDSDFPIHVKTVAMEGCVFKSVAIRKPLYLRTVKGTTFDKIFFAEKTNAGDEYSYFVLLNQCSMSFTSFKNMHHDSLTLLRALPSTRTFTLTDSSFTNITVRILLEQSQNAYKNQICIVRLWFRDVMAVKDMIQLLSLSDVSFMDFHNVTTEFMFHLIDSSFVVPFFSKDNLRISGMTFRNVSTDVVVQIDRFIPGIQLTNWDLESTRDRFSFMQLLTSVAMPMRMILRDSTLLLNSGLFVVCPTCDLYPVFDNFVFINGQSNEPAPFAFGFVRKLHLNGSFEVFHSDRALFVAQEITFYDEEQKMLNLTANKCFTSSYDKVSFLKQCVEVCDIDVGSDGSRDCVSHDPYRITGFKDQKWQVVDQLRLGKVSTSFIFSGEAKPEPLDLIIIDTARDEYVFGTTEDLSIEWTYEQKLPNYLYTFYILGAWGSTAVKSFSKREPYCLPGYAQPDAQSRCVSCINFAHQFSFDNASAECIEDPSMMALGYSVASQLATPVYSIGMGLFVLEDADANTVFLIYCYNAHCNDVSVHSGVSGESMSMMSQEKREFYEYFSGGYNLEEHNGCAEGHYGIACQKCAETFDVNGHIYRIVVNVLGDGCIFVPSFGIVIIAVCLQILAVTGVVILFGYGKKVPWTRIFKFSSDILDHDVWIIITSVKDFILIILPVIWEGGSGNFIIEDNAGSVGITITLALNPFVVVSIIVSYFIRLNGEMNLNNVIFGINLSFMGLLSLFFINYIFYKYRKANQKKLEYNIKVIKNKKLISSLCYFFLPYIIKNSVRLIFFRKPIDVYGRHFSVPNVTSSVFTLIDFAHAYSLTLALTSAFLTVFFFVFALKMKQNVHTVGLKHGFQSFYFFLVLVRAIVTFLTVYTGGSVISQFSASAFLLGLLILLMIVSPFVYPLDILVSWLLLILSLLSVLIQIVLNVEDWELFVVTIALIFCIALIVTRDLNRKFSDDNVQKSLIQRKNYEEIGLSEFLISQP